MQLKAQGFQLTIPQNNPLPQLLLLTGSDVFLAQHFKKAYKKAWLQRHCSNTPQDDGQDYDYQQYNIQQPQDWETIEKELMQYSLLSQLRIIDCSYDKKNLDKTAKNFLTQCLSRVDNTYLLMIHMPNLSSTAIGFTTSHPQAATVAIKPPAQPLVLRWIQDSLKPTFSHIAPDLPQLIYQYTQGNLFACAQLLEILPIAETANQPLTVTAVIPYLQNQAQYQLYDLTQACLLGDSDQAFLTFRCALDNKQEPTLLLWIIAQEIRVLAQLHALQSQGLPFSQAANKLNIWSSRTHHYQNALKRLDANCLNRLLTQCAHLDSVIKTSGSQTTIIRQFERLLAAFCLGDYRFCIT